MYQEDQLEPGTEVYYPAWPKGFVESDHWEVRRGEVICDCGEYCLVQTQEPGVKANVINWLLFHDKVGALLQLKKQAIVLRQNLVMKAMETNLSAGHLLEIIENIDLKIKYIKEDGGTECPA